MIERDKKEGDFGGRGGIHKKLIAFSHLSHLFWEFFTQVY
jgi:hypothetical protein